MAKESVIVESRVRDLLPAGTRLASDALKGLDEWVRGAVQKAVARCEANGRKTVWAADF